MLFTLADVRAKLLTKQANDPTQPPLLGGATLPGANPFRAGGTPETQFAPDVPKPPTPPGGGLLNKKLPTMPTPLGVVRETAAQAVQNPLDYAQRLGAQYFPDMNKSKADLISKATENEPPIKMMPGVQNFLGPLAEPVNAFMGAGQRIFKDNPAGFAGVVGGLGKPLIEPLMGTPFGLPAMAGLYGLTTGGPSLGAAYTYFKPVLDKLNL